MGEHKVNWTILHELKAILIYKKIKDGDYKTKAEAIEKELAKDDTFPKDKTGSVQMKLGNIKYLDTGWQEGLSGVSEQLESVWNKYKDTPKEDIEKVIDEWIKKEKKGPQDE